MRKPASTIPADSISRSARKGCKCGVGSLESLLTSSVTFTDPDPNEPHAKPIPAGESLTLYASLADAKKVDFNPTIPYLLLFTGSVRGLSPDAPVEFRGIRVGSVVAASFKYLPSDPEHRVPVLIKIDPAVLTNKPGGDPAATKSVIAQGVENGLRASLKTGSLLTGQLFVELDFQKNAPPAIITGVGDYAVLPTVPAAGLDELQEKAGSVLDKLNALPVEKIGENANAALASLKEVTGHLDQLTGPGSSLEKTLSNTQKLTGELSGNKDISATLHNLRETSVAIQTSWLESQPGERYRETSALAAHLAHHQEIPQRRRRDAGADPRKSNAHSPPETLSAGS